MAAAPAFQPVRNVLLPALGDTVYAICDKPYYAPLAAALFPARFCRRYRDATGQPCRCPGLKTLREIIRDDVIPHIAGHADNANEMELIVALLRNSFFARAMRWATDKVFDAAESANEEDALAAGLAAFLLNGLVLSGSFWGIKCLGPSGWIVTVAFSSAAGCMAPWFIEDENLDESIRLGRTRLQRLTVFLQRPFEAFFGHARPIQIQH
jgi:hypothetical protein